MVETKRSDNKSTRRIYRSSKSYGKNLVEPCSQLVSSELIFKAWHKRYGQKNNK